MQNNEATFDQTISRTVAQSILDQLKLWGVKRIYGVVGDAIFGLLDAIANQKDIQFIGVKHESVASLMASSEAKLTGNVGVCVAQMGPGLANLANGLADAHLDKAPVLAITGQAPVKKIGTPYKQFINQQEFMQAISGSSELVVHPDAAVVALNKALHTAVARETVAHLSIPTDVFDQITYLQPFKPSHQQTIGYCQKQFDRAVTLMEKAKSPMIMVGNKIRPLQTEIEKLAENWGGGIVSAYGAIGLFGIDSPFYIGGIGEGGNPDVTGLFKQADVILAIGTTWWPAGFTPKDITIIQVQDKEIQIGEGMPTDHSVIGNIQDIIPGFVEKMQSLHSNSGWVQKINQCHAKWTMPKEAGTQTAPFSPAIIAQAVENCATEDTIIALDEGDSTLWSMSNFRIKCHAVLLSRMWRTMGYGLPAALAAKLTLPDKHVVCMTGDGGLAMVLADLLTAARYKLNVTVVVFNNGTLQMERNKMTVKGLVPEGTDITNPNFTALARACGWDAHTVQHEQDLDRLLKAAQTNQKPVLLDVPTLQESYPNYQLQ